MINQELLKELFDYNLDNGNFTWLTNRGKNLLVNTIAGTNVGNGYTRIRINGKQYLAHRLAWLYVYGVWPIEQLDHINGIRSDNRLSNLREATNKENNVNRGLTKVNTSGYKGVSWSKHANKWLSRIMVNGKSLHLGYFIDKDEAIEAYKQAAIIHHGSFINLS